MELQIFDSYRSHVTKWQQISEGVGDFDFHTPVSALVIVPDPSGQSQRQTQPGMSFPDFSAAPGLLWRWVGLISPNLGNDQVFENCFGTQNNVLNVASKQKVRKI